MMPPTNFTVSGEFKAIITDGADEGNEPDVQNISALVTFTPSISEAQIGTTTWRLTPLIARTEEDGILKTIDSTEDVALPCGDATEGNPLFGLTYKVEFSKVNYNKLRDQRIEPFRFAAPTTATSVDLATVERLPL